MNTANYREAKTKFRVAMDLAVSGQSSELLDYLASIKAEKLIADALRVDFSVGIKNSEAEQRRLELGSNEIDGRQNQPSLCRAILDAFGDNVLLFLLVVSLLSVVVNYVLDPEHRSVGCVEGASIFVVVSGSALIQTFRNYRKEKELQRFRELTTNFAIRRVTVIRDGSIVEIGEFQVVPGDILRIRAGDKVPADGFILEGHGLTIDQSSLTGEPTAIKKISLSECSRLRDNITTAGNRNNMLEEPSPVLFAGTAVIEGDGKFVAIFVGSETKMGEIGNLAQPVSQKNVSPLQIKLENLSVKVRRYGLLAGLLILFVLLARFLLQGVKNGGFRWTELAHYLIVSTMTVIVAIPNSFSLILALLLANTASNLLKERNLVKNLQACEYLGSVDTLCVEKTGVLTTNKIQMAGFWNETFKKIDSNRNNMNVVDVIGSGQHEAGKDLFLQACICNNPASLEPRVGSAIDIALLEFASKIVSVPAYKSKYPASETFPFSSKRKQMSTIIEKVPNGMNGRRLYTRGVSERILASCNQIHLMSQNKVALITPQLRASIEDALRQMAEQAYRTVAIAYKDIVEGEDLKTVDEMDLHIIEKDRLTLIGIIAVADPLRLETTDAIQRFKQAGIKVIMSTGDSKVTSTVIAKECGLTTSSSAEAEGSVLEGSEFSSRVGAKYGKVENKQEFIKIVRNLDVLARARPEDKRALVAGLHDLGHVVAATGSETADAPALKTADVGFALGISSTDIAKDAADIILLDDNFSSILSAVILGRNIHFTIKKCIQFLFTANLVIILLTLFGSTFYGMAIITPVQIIWINLVVGALAVAALPSKQPDSSLLSKRPRGKLFTGHTAKFIIVHAAYQLLVLVSLICFGDQFIPEQSNLEDARDFAQEEEGTQTQIRFSPYGNGSQYVISGRLYHINGADDYYPYQRELGSSRHLTVIFNTYVFLQIFNLFNARRLENNFNIFKGLLRNLQFVGIIALVVILQVLLGTFGGRAFSVFRDGMTLPQWGIAIGFGLSGWVIGALAKLIPARSRQNAMRQQNWVPLNEEPEYELM